jgi:hypothetical protein
MTDEFGQGWPIDSEGVTHAVQQSGYPFELEIARRIESYGFFVTPNYNFEDHDTGQSREIDIHALTAEAVAFQRYEFLYPLLLASCKANEDPYVFFTRDNILSKIQLQVDPPLSGIPATIVNGEGESLPAADFFRLEEFLHIAGAERISSQFCQLTRRGDKWAISQAPVVESIVIPVIKALAREISDHNSKTGEPTPDENDSNYQIYYPVIIVRGPLFEYYVPAEGGTPEVSPNRHIVFFRHYQSSTLQGEFAIDVIHETFLEEFLDLIAREGKKFANRIRRHRKRIVASIQHLRKKEQEEKEVRLV